MLNFLENLDKYLEELIKDPHRRMNEILFVLLLAVGPWLVGVYFIISAPFKVLFSGI